MAAGPPGGLRIMPLAFVAVRRGPPPAFRESGTRSPAGHAPQRVHLALLGGFQPRMPTSTSIDVLAEVSMIHRIRRPPILDCGGPGEHAGHAQLLRSRWEFLGKLFRCPFRGGGCANCDPDTLDVSLGPLVLQLPSLPVVGAHGGIPHSMIASGRSSRTASRRTHSKTSSLRLAPMRRCGIAASGPELPSSHASVASVAFASSSARGAR